MAHLRESAVGGRGSGLRDLASVAKFPEPPSSLGLPPEIARFRRGERLWRIYYRGGDHPTAWNAFRRFGPTNARFDHPLPPPRLQDRGIMYGAIGPVAATTCLAEVFQSLRVIDRAGNAPWLVGFELERPLALLDLTSAWPTRAGASMAINSGPRPRARRWSQLIYATYAEIDGLLYSSSMHGNAPAVALFERAGVALPPAPDFHRSLSDPALSPRLSAAAARLGFEVV
jgi:hypothetical protein